MLSKRRPEVRPQATEFYYRLEMVEMAADTPSYPTFKARPTHIIDFLCSSRSVSLQLRSRSWKQVQYPEKLKAGDRNIFKAYASHCRYKGKWHRGIHNRRLVELAALVIP